ncbi:phosphoenolpyruvate--protein phosphotransferase [Halobacteriovorax sp. HLS]|uniref:phosphoenolpyruvate--protein phosphotransferase n=1 Tax=Halobacteriovorax sp. HLS TaxID=2234000 RepID=UPI000FDCD8EE|nr:phosphoenolpyruvate--protein phosphotransferase [Halobacteriovorax sp. HLS]
MFGKSASPGLAFGKVVIVEDIFDKVTATKIDDTSSEVERFESILKEVVGELETLSKEALQKDQQEIFEAHSMLAADPSFKKEVLKLISESSFSLSYALKETGLSFMAKFEALEDDYFKERALDIKDITTRFISKSMGLSTSSLRNLPNDVVLVARDLTPSQTAAIDKTKVKGFITELGGVTSHTAIIARTLEIPAIVGAKGLLSEVSNGDLLALDGLSGQVFLKPSDDFIGELKVQIEKEQEYKEALKTYIDKETITSDGHKLKVLGNISSVEDAKNVLKNGGEGIGLLRTEFLYMESSAAPNEEKQFNFYKEILEIMGKRPVTIRTFDIGGDKEVSYLNLEKEDNPFLGYRAIRISLDEIDLFKTQLRAILRASVFGNAKIMFPMIATHREILRAKEILEQCKQELSNEGLDFDQEIEIGIMIEIPAAAIMADLLAKEVDFFSIGTNDLIQYTMAVDRMNDKLDDLYSFYDPSVIRLISMTINGAKSAGIPVGMCGSMASELQLTELLVGLGLSTFSVTSGSILSVRKNIIETSFSKCDELVPSALNSSDKSHILEMFTL